MKLSHRIGVFGVAVATALGLTACADNGGDADTTHVSTSEAASSQSGTSQTQAADGAVTVTDAAGRTLQFDELPERIVLAEGRAAYATALLQDEPLRNVVAYGQDLEKAAGAFRDKLFELQPEAKDMPTIGMIQKGDVTVENLLAQRPDVVIMTLDQKKAVEESGFLSDMDAAGLKYAFIDFRQKPLENTTVSMQLLGDLLGQSERAEQYNEFYNAKVKEITDRVADTTDRPNVLIWMAAGFNDCCAVAGDSNLGTLVTAAGGHNLGPEVLGAENTTITAEKLIELNPDKLIVTGGEWARDPNRTDAIRHVELGYQSSPELALQTCDGPLSQAGMDQLDATKTGNYFAVYHQFYDNPYNVFALEAFAKWIHPEQFADLNPTQDFKDFHKEWLPFDYSGAFFIDPANPEES
ncbi:ABC transporter substrate-binding protein [Corynebacterium sp. zg912]|uniref:ABC transporter substrate-binding protein n=1 Tax=Corynebacterium wankanglinii TaxID=2735136 RepID=A0A7H0KBX9_9CORY|nr:MULTISPECIES: ABC transporter substrate-binding protein [Corynebacterium]MBA1837689.1 ABC transporter substrate-binding protein [Corynebacterium wankanglinii]MCR5928855.1 ABC transporter substrate-binding protein [Corynebacterium sp. zg912]QNP94795.1 ABC transporter substrate-binding protein [Corynebacterium wankanglinii]